MFCHQTILTRETHFTFWLTCLKSYVLQQRNVSTTCHTMIPSSKEGCTSIMHLKDRTHCVSSWLNEYLGDTTALLFTSLILVGKICVFMWAFLLAAGKGGKCFWNTFTVDLAHSGMQHHHKLICLQCMEEWSIRWCQDFFLQHLSGLRYFCVFSCIR